MNAIEDFALAITKASKIDQYRQSVIQVRD